MLTLFYVFLVQVYLKMNAALRDQNRASVRPWRDFIWLVLTGLRLLPTVAASGGLHTLYRGMKVLMIAELKEKISIGCLKLFLNY